MLALAGVAGPGAPTVLARGDEPPPLTLQVALTAWTIEPLALAGILAALVAYLAAARRVDRAHPANPVPRRRVAAWLAGLACLALALFSPLDVYADTLFSAHMVQHLVIVFAAAPLLVLGAPITLLLRAATPAARARWVLPALRSRVVRTIGHPVFAWLTFGAGMWILHLSPIFNLALRDDAVHAAEHLLFLGTAFLFWWPVAGVDPGPHPLSHPLRIGYVMLAMPLNGFLGLALFSAAEPLYSNYVVGRPAWAGDALADQQLGGGLMWVAGDLLFLLPLLLVVWAWFGAEEAAGRREDARLARERASRDRQREREAPAGDATDG